MLTLNLRKVIISEHWYIVTDQSSGSRPGKPSADRYRCRDGQCRKKQIQPGVPEHRLLHPDHRRDVYSSVQILTVTAIDRDPEVGILKYH